MRVDVFVGRIVGGAGKFLQVHTGIQEEMKCGRLWRVRDNEEINFGSELKTIRMLNAHYLKKLSDAALVGKNTEKDFFFFLHM